MNALLSRADLLRALALAPLEMQQNLAIACGFVRHQKITADLPDTALHTLQGQVLPVYSQQVLNDGIIYLPKQLPQYWTVVASEPIQRIALGDTQQAWPELIEQDSPPREWPQRSALRSKGQWQNLWDQTISGRRRGRRLDLSKSLQRMLKAEPMNQLPRRERMSFNRPVVLLFQRSDALYPLWADMHDAWHSLSRLMGKRALHSFSMQDDPWGEWRYFDRPSTAGPGTVGIEQLPASAQVLLIGTFGALANSDGMGASVGQLSASWHRFIGTLQSAGHQVTLVSACHLQDAPCHYQQLDPTQSKAHQADHAVEQALLATIARLCLPDRQQLRNLRQALPGVGVDAELLVWGHPLVNIYDRQVCMSTEVLAQCSAYYSDIPLPWRSALDRASTQCIQSMDEVARDISYLQTNDGSVPPASEFPALQRYGQAVEQQRQQGLNNSHEQAVMRNILPGLHVLRGQSMASGWQRFLSEAQRVALQNGVATPLGDQGVEEQRGSHWLYQQHHGLGLKDNRAAHATPVLQLNAQPWCEQTRTTLSGKLPTSFTELDLKDVDRHSRLERLTRPTWAERIWRDQNGLFAAHTQGLILRYYEASTTQPQAQWQVEHNPWPWVSDTGVDEYGLWVDIRIQQISQRLRWIAPGSFEMGSPETEPERSNDEDQHHVSLSRGYWLADTACTQTLWREVMGKNPSHFKKHAENPVEQASWEDCQGFIRKLNVQIGDGFQFRLPSEAEWEYACRAGSKRAFSWGDSLCTEQANYHGDYPYNDAAKSEVRGHTVSVKSFEANPWGLYQMHGNVYEWCEDWLGEYPVGPVIDPAGPDGGQYRVLRGGSWFNFGRYLRSAYRSGFQPGDRYRRVGLRLAGGLDPQASQVASGMSADRKESPK